LNKKLLFRRRFIKARLATGNSFISLIAYHYTIRSPLLIFLAEKWDPQMQEVSAHFTADDGSL